MNHAARRKDHLYRREDASPALGGDTVLAAKAAGIEYGPSQQKAKN
jgi:hypothetical protein